MTTLDASGPLDSAETIPTGPVRLRENDGPVEIVGLRRQPPALLVVNDGEIQRIAIRSIVAALDVTVVEAESGPAAREAT